MPSHFSELFGPPLHGVDDIRVQALMLFSGLLDGVFEELVVSFESFRYLFECLVEFLMTFAMISMFGKCGLEWSN